MLKKLKAVIPAAGLATRFLPASKVIPKEMFPIYDRPSIQYIVEELVESGIEDIIFVTRRGKEAVEDHFDTISRDFPLHKLSDDIREEVENLNTLANVISLRQKDPKGLGHAVLCGKPALDNSAFVVALPDDIVISLGRPSFLEKMIELHKKENCSVIALVRVPEKDVSKYGIAEGVVSGSVVDIKNLIEKPSPKDTESDLAIIGRYVLDNDVLDILENTPPGAKGEIQLTDAIKTLAERKSVKGLIISDDELRFDSGDKTGYALINSYIAYQKDSVYRDTIKKLLD